jgi:hypothetical protein
VFREQRALEERCSRGLRLGCLGCGEKFGCGDGVVTGCLYPYTHILVMLKGLYTSDV